jgi:hypothetical protein
MDYIANKLKMGKKTNEEKQKISKLNRKSSFQVTFNKYNHYVCGFHLLCEKINYNFIVYKRNTIVMYGVYTPNIYYYYFARSNDLLKCFGFAFYEFKIPHLPNNFMYV